MKLGSISKSTLLSMDALVESVDGKGFAAGEFGRGVVFLDVGTVAGTTPTLDVKIQDSADGENWHDIPDAAFTQITAADNQRIVVPNLGQHVRAVATVGGTDPEFTGTVAIVGNR